MNIESILHEVVELLQSIIRIPSFSKHEDKVSLLLEEYIKKQGIRPQRLGNNLIIRSERKNKNLPTLLLNSHMDTVQPVSSWSKDPFSPIIKEGKLYGLGSNDAGASLVTMLVSTIHLYDKLDYNLVFCASAEEEISGKNGISMVLKHNSNFDLAIVGEPTNMQPAVAEKGLMVLDCEALGQAGHAARDEGINAIYQALNDLRWFKNYEFKKTSPFLGPVKMNVTQINAGKQHNVIPDTCSFVVDVRGNGCYSNSELLDIIQQNTYSQIQARSTHLNSSQLPQDHQFYHYLVKSGYQPFGSPTLSDQALMPFPSIKMGPGDSSRSHTADEFITIDELRDALTKYKKILTEFRFK